MQTFRYTARNTATGQKVRALVQAEDETSAAKLISQQGLAPIDIKKSNDSQSNPVGKFLGRPRAKDRILFSRQLSTLINAGLPLAQSLHNVSNQAENKQFRSIISQIINDVEAGSAFSVALSKHPRVFNEVFVSLVASGEASGTLDTTLDRLATQQEKDEEILSKVRGAMVYPIIVMVVMLAVIGFMVVKVLPQVKVLYAGIPGATLPLITRVMLAISDFVIKDWWVVIVIAILAIFFTSRWAHTLTGRSFMDRAKMRAWPIGPLFMKLYMARFSRTGATLIASGVPLLQMLEIDGNAVNNIHIKNSLIAASEKVKGGKSLAEALQGDPNFLTLVPDMLKIGEQSGAMQQMMEKTADYYEKQVDAQIKTISTIVEPVMMILLGIVAFIIVAAVLLPIYGLASKIGGIV